MNNLILKKKALESELHKLNSLAVAFSGGADSTFLLAMAKKVFQHNDRLVAITAVSPVHPQKDIQCAEWFTQKNNIRHVMVHTLEMESSAFLENPPDR